MGHAPRPGLLAPLAVIAVAVAACAVWANVPRYYVIDDDDCRYFPPFRVGVNRVYTHHLGGEYLHIARALRAGRGFADPFRVESGPTAWMPPALPAALTTFLWLADDDEKVVTNVVVTFQSVALVVTGWLMLAAARAAFPRAQLWPACGLYLLFLAADFNAAFQITHDPWLLMLGLAAVLAGYARLPDRAGPRAVVVWGVGGGLAALVGPVLGLVWAVLTADRWPRWRPWAAAAGVAALTVSPWVARNYAVFGAVIPVKSNAFYELYQSQLLTRDGLIRQTIWPTHPYHTGDERDRYLELGEQAYLAEKKALALASLRAAPGDYAVRVWNRLAAATLVYVPLDEKEERASPGAWDLLPWVCHPLPALAAVLLLVWPRRLHRYERAALLVYAAWLLPYVLVSYYPRYGFPLVGVKVFLCLAALSRLVPRRPTPTAAAPNPQPRPENPS
ncbi:hypothetical protein J0H58_06180 [bacterium]|nr:hypothetical protein [bacterium]